MTEILFNEIPSLDLADFLSGEPTRKAQFVQDLGAAFNKIGFVAIKNHGLSDELVAQLYDIYMQFFRLPEEVKRQYEIAGIAGQRGYTGKGKEHAKGRATGDLKEFYHVGQNVIDGDPIRHEYPDNVFASELPTMQSVSLEAYSTLETAGKNILRAIALYLGLKEDYFDNKVHNGNSILRAIHYYPIENPDEVPADAVRAAEHGDINLITLLMGASAEGLQILRKDGQWIPVTALPEQIVVNVGDMLERLTNNKLKSTIHRVVNPPREKMGTSRYSIPFFMHPRSEMDLTCLSACIDAEHPNQYPDITAGEFLNQRLAEIGLKK
ncbi:MAG: isopenicillin N synthase family oxygenase [Microscillaceae bacterium]|jgi:isopenicillin N synthase-like dioxygenase|nr:isopenicillin N synthase family oxygenase [Microscillaceae bacterium]